MPVTVGFGEVDVQEVDGLIGVFDLPIFLELRGEFVKQVVAFWLGTGSVCAYEEVVDVAAKEQDVGVSAQVENARVVF